MPALQRALYEADALEQRRPCTRTSLLTRSQKCPAVHKYFVKNLLFWIILFYWTAKKKKNHNCVCILWQTIFSMWWSKKKKLSYFCVFERSPCFTVLRHSAKHLILHFTDENQTQARVNEEPSFFRRAFFNSHSTHHQTTVLHLNACSKLNGWVLCARPPCFEFEPQLHTIYNRIWQFSPTNISKLTERLRWFRSDIKECFTHNPFWFSPDHLD